MAKYSYTSKGERRNLSRRSRNLGKRSITAEHKITCQVDRWNRQENFLLTIRNPDKKETDKKFIKISAMKYWGRTPKPFYMGEVKKNDPRVLKVQREAIKNNQDYYMG